MSWWQKALYDTCSLITLDKLLQIEPGLSRWFPKKVLALEASLTADQMREETSLRLKEVTEYFPLPNLAVLATLLSSASLSQALSDVDKLVYAAAVHSRCSVVTGDKRLAKAIQQQGIEVGSMALVLQELVEKKKLKATDAEEILRELADRKDFLLGIPNPTWCDNTAIELFLASVRNWEAGVRRRLDVEGLSVELGILYNNRVEMLTRIA